MNAGTLHAPPILYVIRRLLGMDPVRDALSRILILRGLPYVMFPDSKTKLFVDTRWGMFLWGQFNIRERTLVSRRREREAGSPACMFCHISAPEKFRPV